MAGYLGESEKLRELSRLRKDYQVNVWHNALLHFGIKDQTLAVELSENFNREYQKRQIFLKNNYIQNSFY